MNQNQSIDLALCDQPCRYGRFPKRRRGAENSVVVDADPFDSLLLDGPKLTIEFHCDGWAGPTNRSSRTSGRMLCACKRAITSVRHPRGTAMCWGKSWPHGITRGLAYVGSRIA